MRHSRYRSARQPRPGGLGIVFFNRRDTSNPEGGGSELYVEVVARALALSGNRVTVFSADHRTSPRDSELEGVHYRRRGGKLSVLPRAWFDLLTRRLGPVDLVIDVQNGVPFLSPFATRAPVVALVHHVHREMWPVVYGRTAARLGWWVESRLAPLIYRRSAYVAVSRATRDELEALGVDGSRIAVVHNGVSAALPVTETRSTTPTIVCLGRLVPHKQVLHLLEAAADLRHEFPDLHVRVVGDGWWADQLRADAVALDVHDIVEFTGFVDDEQKANELARAWVLAIPSLKEGWGLVVVEAATYGVPAIGYRSAAGVAESIVDGVTGLVVDGGSKEFTDALGRILRDCRLRDELGRAAKARAEQFSWSTTAEEFGAVLAAVATQHGLVDSSMVEDMEPVTLSGPKGSSGEWL